VGAVDAGAHDVLRFSTTFTTFFDPVCMLDRNPLTPRCGTLDRRRPSALSDRRFVLGKSSVLV